MTRALVVSEILPWGQFGGGMRIRLATEALAEIGPVDLLAIPHQGTPGTGMAPTGFDRVHMTPNCANVSQTRAQILADAPDWLVGTAYDLVWYNREVSWLTARELVQGPAVIDVDDLSEVLLKRWMDLGLDAEGLPLSPVSRAKMATAITQSDAIHKEAAAEADLLVFSSEVDQRRFGFQNSTVVVNAYDVNACDGVASARFAPDARGGDIPTILFQGLLEWSPNEDAAIWLVKAIAPLVREQLPALRVILAGKPSPRVQALGAWQGTELAGAVPNMAPYLRAADAVVVPLRVGAGTRIKILEAFSYRVPVVATRIGAEGLDVVDGVHLELADEVVELASRCVRVLQDKPAARRLTDAAFDLCDRRYRRHHAVQQVHEAVRTVLGA